MRADFLKMPPAEKARFYEISCMELATFLEWREANPGKLMSVFVALLEDSDDDNVKYVLEKISNFHSGCIQIPTGYGQQ